MKVKETIFFLLVMTLLLFSSSCKPSYTEQETEEFAKKQCKAIELKNARFALSDHIRLLEEDMVKNKYTIDTLRKKADELKIQSLVLADSIKKMSDYLFYEKMKTQEEKQQFLKDADEYLKKWACQ